VKEWLQARRWLVAAVVAYLIVVGALAARCVAPRGARAEAGGVEYRAARDLRRNHRVEAPDLRRPDRLPGSLHWRLPDRARLEGQYLRSRVDRGTPVRLEDVEPWPDLSPGPDAVPMTFPLPDEPIDAGSRVDVCPAAGPCVVTDAAVIAVVCRKPPACSAAVAVPRASSAAVREAAGKGKLGLRLIAL
jgi:hypothetical protein